MKKILLAAALAANTLIALPAHAEVPRDFSIKLADEWRMCSVVALFVRNKDGMNVERWTNRHYALKQLAKELYLDAGIPLTRTSYDQMFVDGMTRFVNLVDVDRAAMYRACADNFQSADKLCKDPQARCPYQVQ